MIKSLLLKLFYLLKIYLIYRINNYKNIIENNQLKMGNEYSGYPAPGYYPPGVIRSVVQQPYYQKQISIKLNKFDYFKGDYVEGTIIVNNSGSLVLNDIHLNLYLMENWRYQSGDLIQAELNNPLLLTVRIGIQKILKINSDLINLNPGVFNFPFKFKLPDYLQPSFEHPKNNQRAFLRYVLQAKILSQFVQGEGNAIIFIKSRPLLLNCPLSYSSATNVHKWGMFDGGSTLIKVNYPTSNYQIRGQIPITVEINNTRGKLQVRSVICKVIRRVQFKRVQEAVVKYSLQTIIVNKSFDVNVPPFTQSQTYNYTIELNDTTLPNYNYLGTSNPYPRLVDLSYAMPTTDGAAVKCDYYLLVTVSFSNFVTQSYLPKVCIPFTLTHQLTNDYSLEQKEDEDLKRAIEASLLDMKQIENINQSNINEIVLDKDKNEILINGKNIENNQNNNNINNNFVDINQVDNNNIIQENNNQQMMNNINNNINNNVNNSINNNINNNNISEIININNNNNINNNINVNQISNAYNHESNFNNNNNIKFDEEDNDIINPYKSDYDIKEPNNFGSINDFEDEDNDNDMNNYIK